jgi:hypothetical protein
LLKIRDIMLIASGITLCLIILVIGVIIGQNVGVFNFTATPTPKPLHYNDQVVGVWNTNDDIALFRFYGNDSFIAQIFKKGYDLEVLEEPAIAYGNWFNSGINQYSCYITYAKINGQVQDLNGNKVNQQFQFVVTNGNTAQFIGQSVNNMIKISENPDERFLTPTYVPPIFVPSSVPVSTGLPRSRMVAIEVARVNQSFIYVKNMGGQDSSAVRGIHVISNGIEVYSSGYPSFSSLVGSLAYFNPINPNSQVAVILDFNDETQQVVWTGTIQ